MKKKLVKFILISILIIILCVIYLFYINSNEYKKEHKIKVVENMNILVNDIYVSNTKLSSYNWNEGKIEEGLEEIIKVDNININDINVININNLDILKFTLNSRKYSSNKYKIQSAHIELYLNDKLFMTYKSKIEDNNIILKEKIEPNNYICKLNVIFKNRGNVEQTFKLNVK